MKGERPEADFSPLLLYKFRLRNDHEDLLIICIRINDRYLAIQPAHLLSNTSL